MFDVFCRRHGSRVLLSTGNIEALLNQPDGVELHWHCWCGEHGVTHVRKVTARSTEERHAGGGRQARWQPGRESSWRRAAAP